MTPVTPPSSSIFFSPPEGWVGDVIPFLHDGAFWLYFLLERRDSPKPGTAWALVTTEDFVDFTYQGVALPAGDELDADFNAFTGSVVMDGDTAHLFYTGHNPRILLDSGKPQQVVMHATSDDGLKTWVKHPKLTFGAPEGYDPADWRDPFVFRPSPDARWQMLLAARHDSGPERRRGVIARCVSDDLLTWTTIAPIWDPRRYVTHECPEVFQWGEHWYLVFSEFSERFTTRYRISASPEGPWEVPALDTIDGRAFYASKSVERDGRRFFIGWIATKEDAIDDGAWEWAGTMSVLEAQKSPDGMLGFTIPCEIRDSFCIDTSVTMPDVTLKTMDGYQVRMSAEPIPQQCLITTSIDVTTSTTECGVLLRASEDGDESYIIRLEPRRQRLVFDRWPRARTGDEPWQASGDVPHFVELERPCRLDAGIHTLRIMLDDTLLIAVLDDEVALSTRIYDHTRGHMGLFVGEGNARFSHTSVTVRA